MRKITQEDIAFLKNIQHELNTQDHMYTADPRYWGIMQSNAAPCPEEFADDYILYSSEDEVATGAKNAFHWLLENMESFTEYCKNYDITAENVSVDDIHDYLESEPLTEFSFWPVRFEKQIVRNAFFLTYKDAKDHLKKYGYNYDKSAKPYCMRADRSPAYETLITLLQSVDWDSINPHNA